MMLCLIVGLAASNSVKSFDYLPPIGTSLIRRGLAFMLHDTFETNLGLRELFKRKIIERARFVGLSDDLIEELSKNSDYFRIKPVQPLRGAALEQSWRSYERNNGHKIPELTRTQQPPTAREIMPELVITYTIGRQPTTARKDAPEEREPISMNPILRQAEADPAASSYRELVKSILDRVTAMAGEKATKAILHQIGREIGRTPFNHSRGQIQSDDPAQALDHFLNSRGWGRVQDLATKNKH
jgi:hypothetical protein